MAQSVKHPTLGFCLGHDLTVREFELCIGLCADNMEPAWDSLSPSLSAPPLTLQVWGEAERGGDSSESDGGLELTNREIMT